MLKRYSFLVGRRIRETAPFQTQALFVWSGLAGDLSMFILATVFFLHCYSHYLLKISCRLGESLEGQVRDTALRSRDKAAEKT